MAGITAVLVVRVVRLGIRHDRQGAVIDRVDGADRARDGQAEGGAERPWRDGNVVLRIELSLC